MAILLRKCDLFFTPLYQFSHQVIIKESVTRKVKQLPECSFGEICSQRLTTSSSTTNYKQEGYYK